MTIVFQLNTFDLLKYYHNNQVNNNCLPISNAEVAYAIENGLVDSLQSLLNGVVTNEDFSIFIAGEVVHNNDVAKFSELKVAFQTLGNTNNMGNYVFPYSKTNFRRLIFNNMPESLYKKYFKFLKNYDVITKATGSLVTVRLINDADKEIFSEEEIFSLTTSYTAIDFNKLINSVEEMQSDIEYYLQYIASLSDIVEKAEAEKSQALEKLHNQQVISWY